MIFDELDQRMGIVPRWVVVRTIQKQSVAEHCFNVERIARGIAEQWFNISYSMFLDEISQLALHHDDDEAITGDIPSPAKERPLDSDPGLCYDGAVSARYIVKLADLMETTWFLAMEFRMGNRYITDHLRTMVERTLKHANLHNPNVSREVAKWIKALYDMESKTYDRTAGSPEEGPAGEQR